MTRLEDPGQLRYDEWPAYARLRGAVAAMWRAEVTGAAAHRLHVLPDGCVEIVWDAAGRGLVYGPMTEWQEIELAPGAVHHGVRLRPGAVGLLGLDATDLAGRTADLSVLGIQGSLRSRAEQWRGDDAVLEAIDLLQTEPGIPVAAVARRTYVSERHLRRRFARAVGLTPTAYRRVARVNATLRAAAVVPNPTWADLAPKLGYSDQAHLSREVRALTGRSPTAMFGAGN